MALQEPPLFCYKQLESTLNVDKNLASLVLDESISIIGSENVFPNQSTISNTNFNQNFNPLTLQLLNNSMEVDLNMSIRPHYSFKFLILDQFLKGYASLYLSLGMVVAIIFGTREVLIDTTVANPLWNYLGIPYCGLIGVTVILIIMSKIFVYRNGQCLEPRKTVNNYLFYSHIVLPACLSCFSMLFQLLRDTQFLFHCTVIVDILLPIFRILFILCGIIITSDLINHKVSEGANNRFYLIYKFAATLTFVTSINLALFNFVNTETTYLQKFFSKYMKNSEAIYCNSNYSNNTYISIERSTFKYLHVFSVIYSVMSILLLLEPLKQLFDYKNLNFVPNHQLILNYQDMPKHRLMPKYLSLVIIISMIFFVFSSVIIILEIMANSIPSIQERVRLAINLIFIPTFLITTLISLVMLRLLHKTYPMKSKLDMSPVPIMIIWVSLCGLFITIIRDIHNKVYSQNQNMDLATILEVVVIFENIIQALVQSMMMDFLFQIDWSHRPRQSELNKIYYCCIPLIAMNIGSFLSDFYNVSGSRIGFQKPNDTFHIVTWDLFSAIGNPFPIVFRFFGITSIFIFIIETSCSQINKDK